MHRLLAAEIKQRNVIILILLLFFIQLIFVFFHLNLPSLGIGNLNLLLHFKGNQSEHEVEIKRVNYIRELKSSGKRFQSLLRGGIVGSLKGNIGLRWNHRSVQRALSPANSITNYDYATCPLHDFDCVVLYPLPESVFPTTVTYCLHGNDYVSNIIRSNTIWESEIVYFMWAVLAQDPELQFIDIGVHIGTMSMIAAKMDRQVIAVEALNATLNVLCKSVIANDATTKVTIIPFAVSDNRTRFAVNIPSGNLGGTRLENRAPDSNSVTVTSILTDDLVQFIKFQKAILKIDIEAHEPQAFKAATQLFAKVFIPVIIMEWGTMHEDINAGKKEGPYYILDFLHNKGYMPYAYGGNKLNISTHDQWGVDVYWLHNSYSFEIDVWSVY